MCGIGGAVSLSRDPVPRLEEVLRSLNSAQAHRGPDGAAVWVDPAGRAGLACRRLAVLDAERGMQPMGDEGERWIVHNGEIYNGRELRTELGAGGFHSRSDTEVVLRSYGRWGDACPGRLRGMFAFAIWDEDGQSLVCARDRFGIKPFYYTVAGGIFYFASELKALLPFAADLAVSDEALADYLTFQVYLGAKTMFRGIHELPPAHILALGRGTIELRRYWEPRGEPDLSRSDTSTEDELRALLSEAVDLHLRADVPVGAYLSGGLDSTILATLPGTPRLAFTGAFPEPGYDERPHARAVARAHGIELHELEIGQQDFVDALPEVIRHLEQPVAGPGAVPQYLVSRLAARHRKVVLSGLGADELFGGYARYLIAQGHSVPGYDTLSAQATQAGDAAARYVQLVRRTDEQDPAIQLADGYSPVAAFRAYFESCAASDLERTLRVDLHTLLPALLHVEDRVAMAHGLESRVPFLDHRVVELALTIPASAKLAGGTLKQVLKRAFREELPYSVLQRPDKMGFPVPLQEWLAEGGPFRDFVFDTLGSAAARDRAGVDNRAALATVGSERPYGRRLWGLLCLELWRKVIVDKLLA